MNIVVTGSLGNISKPLTINLVHKGHAVTVISSNPEKLQAIESLGVVGSVAHLLRFQQPEDKWKELPFARFLVEMQFITHSGQAAKDYYLDRPVSGKVKLKDFAREFAACYAIN